MGKHFQNKWKQNFLGKKTQKLQKEPNDLKEERKADMGEVKREKAKQINKND